ncbi:MULTISPECIES: DUF4011 domain-containing protein [unclassified Actinoplanes]|uniref:DUF4011 domain-containing protein n=1 Tax=unclassified Actinoplanes TaxID=2626549 RepID=UPI000319BB7A|nr:MULTISPECIES: DUF4011 domain-containing protein [unclassified Actinoplanes]
MRATLEQWRDGLLDLTGANPLIDVRTTAPGVVEIVSPSPRSVVEALQQGRECGFLGIEEQAEGPRPRAAHVFQTTMADAEMDATLRALRRAARRDLLEQGVATLYLGLGTVRWRDGANEHISPILLIPVDLITPDPEDYPRLRVRAEDPMVNPALDICLRRHSIELPAVDSLAALDVTVFWARLDAALGDHPDWHSDESVLLARFAVHREVMYTDLLDHERQILSHPVVRALATAPEAQADAFKFEVISGRRIDEVAAPDDVPLVLDADAAQRACIIAALHGRSFVMRGAPGTGKSQTIANMVAGLLHAGRRVLLVAEKAAALDTVRERLEPAGLHDYLLELHSGRTGRDHVAAALAAALDFIPLPPPDLSTDEREALREHRQRLNAYAEAMNEVREPLGHRLHDVLGMCAQMTDVPQAPAPAELPIPLTTQSLQRVRDAAERLGRNWRPAREGDDFLWHDVIDRNRLDARLHQAQAALDHLCEAIERDPLADAFLISSIGEAITLTTLVGHAARRPAEAADDWLTMASLEPVARAAEGLLRHLKTLHQAEDAVRAKAGATWSALPAPAKLPIIPTLLHLNPPAVELLPLTAAQARGLARRFADEADRLEQHQHSLDRVTARLGLPNVVAFTDLPRLTAIVDLLSRPDKPEPAWFDSLGMNAAHAAMRNLRRVVNVVKAAESRAREHFSDNALVEPVDELAERFAHQHKGLRKLSAQSRRDKKAAADIARPDVKRSQAVANLNAAAAWKRALQELAEAEQEYAGILGKHWQGQDTDFDAIERALRTAAQTLEVTPPEALPTLIERICAPTPNSAIIRIVGEAGKEFERWTAALRPPPEPAPRPQLATGPIHDAVTWLRAHVEPFTAVAELVQAYSAAAGRDFTLAEAAAIGLLRESASEAAAALSANAKEYAKVLGPAYRGTQTDVEALATAMAWTSEARRIRNGADIAFTLEQAELLSRTRPSDTLPARVAEWQAARDWILRAFAPSRHPALSAALDERDTSRELLRELLDDTRGQQEWFDCQTARAVLAEHGLDPVVDFCIREDLPVEQLLPVLGRALFQSWADAIIRSDDRLAPLDAVSRDRLVDEFRLWDAGLQRAAAAEVMNAVDALQPAEAAAGEAAMLRAAAAQQGRRLPVRDLFARTARAAMAVKPCLVMSPADVSRLLPPDLHFDVVIIDEASRVPVPDAITCAYRGNALVVCGDDRQLTATPIPGGDSRSILEQALSCDAFRVLDLTTHYRSRDESLIAFANHAFYQGRLHTFPAFAPAGPDRGVQLYPAIGDMPLADLVATRVAHHFVTRPDLSLGVVVCTAEDGYEIEAAVADMIVPPEDDRLRGFFIKGLDAVQGDERDVVIFAINGDLDGLSGPDGWRRLNVATTRARRRLEVVSAVRARDLSENDVSLRHLADFLEYAARGIHALGLEDSHPGESQTPFEDSVRDVIRGWGYRVSTRVGAGAYRIDLAVRRSARRNAPYALGIECDGTTYDSAPTARDRDRIREQVLDSLGWKLHRIWGTAWYLDRDREETRLLAAIQDAFAGLPDEEAPPELGVATAPDQPEDIAHAAPAPADAVEYPVAEAAEGYGAGYADTAGETPAPRTTRLAYDEVVAAVPAAQAAPSSGTVYATAAAPVSTFTQAASDEQVRTFTGSAFTESASAEPVARVTTESSGGGYPDASADSGLDLAEREGLFAWTDADDAGVAQTEAAAEADLADAHDADDRRVTEAALIAGLGLRGSRASSTGMPTTGDVAEFEESAGPPDDGALDERVPLMGGDLPAQSVGATPDEPVVAETSEAGIAVSAGERLAHADHSGLAGVAAEFAFAQAGAEELAAAEAYLGANLEAAIAQLRAGGSESAEWPVEPDGAPAEPAMTATHADSGAAARTDTAATSDDNGSWSAPAMDNPVRAEWPFASRAESPSRSDWSAAAESHPEPPVPGSDPAVGSPLQPLAVGSEADRSIAEAGVDWSADAEEAVVEVQEESTIRAEWPFASRAEAPERVAWPAAGDRPGVQEISWPTADRNTGDQEPRVQDVAWPTAERPGGTRAGREPEVREVAWPTTGQPTSREPQVRNVEWPVAEREERTAADREPRVQRVEWPTATREEGVQWSAATDEPIQPAGRRVSSVEWPTAGAEPAERRVSSVEWPAATREEPAQGTAWPSDTRAREAGTVSWPVVSRDDQTSASREDLAEVAARFGVGTEELAAAAAQFLAGLHETAEPADRLDAISQIRAELTESANLEPELADAAAAVAEQSLLGVRAERPDWFLEMVGQPDLAAAVAEFEETMAAPPGWTHPSVATTGPHLAGAHQPDPVLGSETMLQEETRQDVTARAAETTGAAGAHTGEWAHPYRKADLPPLPAGAVLTDPSLRPELIAAVRRLAEIEGPVHINVALQRMREQWDLARISRPARTAIEAAIEEAGVAWDGTFLGDPDQDIPVVRQRADGVARKADQVSDAELAIALENLVIDGGVLPVDELLAAVTKLYGWSSRRSAELDARLTGMMADLVAEGHLLQQPNGLAAAHGLPDPLQLSRHESGHRHAHHTTRH